MDYQEERRKYKEWLLSLKVGDSVAYDNRFVGDIITKIIKITPTGLIKTEDGHTFKEGRHRVDNWTSHHLKPVTKVVTDGIRRKQLLGKVGGFDFKKLSNEQLERVLQITLEIKNTGTTE